MECKNCGGRGDLSKNGQIIECLACNGTGSVCDICGESCESGTDKCGKCEDNTTP